MFSGQVVIGDILPYTQAIATSGQTVFGTNWTANAASDVVVYQTPSGTPPDDQTQILTSSQYSVAFIGGSQEVQVTLVSGASMGDIVTVTRQTPADRENLYTNTNFTPSMLNQDFGILTLVDQQAQLVNQLIGPRYNYSAVIEDVIDTILPILPENNTWVKNSNNTAIIPYYLPPSGVAPAGATYVLLTTDSVELPNAFGLDTLGTGFLVNVPGTPTLISTSFTGTSGQITITNGLGTGGATNVAISANPIIPGTAGMGIPEGTTGQRIIPGTNISLRYNTTLSAIEYWNGTTWTQLSDDTQVLPGLQNQLAWYATTGDQVSGLPTANNSVLVTSSGGVPSLSTTLPNGISATDMILTDPVITEYIYDTNGNKILSLFKNANAVNYVGINNAPTGDGVSIAAEGTDTNVGISILSQLLGSVYLLSNNNGTESTTTIFEAIPTSLSAVNYLQVTNAATGLIPALMSNGTDSSVPLSLQAKDSYVSISDSSSTISGTLRFYNAAGSHYTSLSVATAQSTNYAAVLPATDGTSGQVIQTNGSGVWSFISLPGTSVTFTGDSGTPFSGDVVTVTGGSTGLTFAASTPDLTLGGLLASTYGGTGVDAPTTHGILIAEGASPMTSIVLSAGQILIGTTSGDPEAAAINSGTGILVGNGSGSITIGLTPIGSNDILANITGGSAAPIPNTLTAIIDAAIGSTQGDILYRNATVWTVLAPGTAGQVLQTGGAAANVAYSTATYPSSTTINQLLYSSSNNVVAGVTAGDYGVLISSSSGVPSWLANGTTGQVLTATTSGTPSWENNEAISVTFTGDSGTPFSTGSVTITGGTTGLTFAASTPDLTLGGTLGLTNGGTNHALTASAGGIVWSDSTKLNILSGTSTASQILLSGNAATPAWSTSTYPSTNAINTLLYASSANVMAALATANNSVLATNGSGVPSLTTTLPSAVQVAVGSLNSGTSASSSTFWRGDGTWATPSGSGTVNSGTAGQVAYYASSTTAVSGGTLSNVLGVIDASNSSAGYIGELTSSVVSSAGNSISTATPFNLTSISLTAGDWDVYGNITYILAGTCSQFNAWISTTSATIPDVSLEYTLVGTFINFAAGIAPYKRINVNTTTTVYLSGYASFTSTATACGGIYARRVR